MSKITIHTLDKLETFNPSYYCECNRSVHCLCKGESVEIIELSGELTKLYNSMSQFSGDYPYNDFNRGAMSMLLEVIKYIESE